MIIKESGCGSPHTVRAKVFDLKHTYFVRVSALFFADTDVN